MEENTPTQYHKIDTQTLIVNIYWQHFSFLDLSVELGQVFEAETANWTSISTITFFHLVI